MSHDDADRLRIDTVELPRVPGRLGLCACPGGRHALMPAQEPPAEHLRRDVESIRDFGAMGVVTLVEEREIAMLGLDALPLELRRAGLWWKHLPITDMGVPGKYFETRWTEEGASIRALLTRGECVVLHCWAGLGRTGTIAARLLIEFGMEPEAAMLRVRNARPGSIQTRKQEKYVLKLRPPAG